MKDAMFAQLLASVSEGGEIMKGNTSPSRTFTLPIPNVKRIRKGYKLSQPQFAALLGISPATLRNWEQGRRKPEGPARVLLQVAAKYPEVLLDSVSLLKSTSRKASKGSSKTTDKR